MCSAAARYDGGARGVSSFASIASFAISPLFDLVVLRSLTPYLQKPILHVELNHSKELLVVFHWDPPLRRFHGGLGWRVSQPDAQVVEHIAQLLLPKKLVLAVVLGRINAEHSSSRVSTTSVVFSALVVLPHVWMRPACMAAGRMLALIQRLLWRTMALAKHRSAKCTSQW